ncbi:Enamine deaminase RidA, house cleaning of reactive enamine intermediates, YjgF/YER057c/UK114 family [Seinonella peptonophila]|uniref:Enamine deaminase RidA, house cleaning of reactive enamine intermediates, YjgF/YER057c/UK114 family n=1 Tax=Seinonella peptonophila TaxID=112248 RepID=A0A1M4T2N2_9BACL|nr:RidA family protein [Seinonella peptonophila]SHE38690.1 Enamine deaminase RidA, house cleaning of reactive enamine intermediates, YjgF/YER057c/UK114 family [Seinonella peptonophila]
MKINHLNPETLHNNPAFTQVITVEGSHQTIYIGGQNAVNITGEIVGDDLATQSEQALNNVVAALAAAGVTKENTVKLTIYIVHGQPLQEAFAAAQKVWGNQPTTITVLQVAGLANPQYLVEIDAIAVKEA